MNTIATASNPSAHQALLERTNSGNATGKAFVAPATAKNDAARGNDRAPPTTVELSDRAKALLERSKIDQAVADWLAVTVKGDGKLPQYTMLLLDEILTVFQAASEQPQAQTVNSAPPVEGARKRQNVAPYGEPTMTDEEYVRRQKDSLLWTADFFDQKGRPPEVGQSLREAVKNGTIRVQNPSDIPGLNFTSVQSFTPSAVGGGYDSFGSITVKPTGAAKEAYEQGRLIVGWSADIGDYCLTW